MTIFHKIASKEIPAFIVMEDENHLAFLDLYPSHKGQTVVIPKLAATSQFSKVTPEILTSTTLFAQKVAQLLEEKLTDILRCEVIIEGFEIDYFHIKVIPIRGIGEIVHHGGPKATEAELVNLLNRLGG